MNRIFEDIYNGFLKHGYTTERFKKIKSKKALDKIREMCIFYGMMAELNDKMEKELARQIEAKKGV